MTSHSFHARNFAHLLGMEVRLTNQVILNVAEKKAMLTVSVDEMAHSLRMVKFTLSKASLFVANLTVSNLLNELIGVSVQHQKSIVGGICDNE